MAVSERTLNRLFKDIRACRICRDAPLKAPLPHEPNPVIQGTSTARICIAGQAPGLRVHETSIPFNDPSGVRLRDWLGVSRDEFYDPKRFAIVPMGFCFPGYNDKGADLPPRKECAPAWHAKVFEHMPQLELIILVGGYAHGFHLGAAAKANVTETVRAWRTYTPRYLPTPHPSWRNNAWLAKNPWFDREVLLWMRGRVRALLA